MEKSMNVKGILLGIGFLFAQFLHYQLDIFKTDSNKLITHLLPPVFNLFIILS
jgi:hypothetical protein